MRKEHKKYIDNLLLTDEIAGNYLKEGYNKENYIKTLLDWNEKCRDAYLENKDLINDIFYQYKNNDSLMNQDVYQELHDFSVSLMANHEQKDTVLALEINEFLLNYARKINDVDMILESAYYCGLAAHFMVTWFDDMENEYFKIALDYYDDYFKLSSKSRLYFNRMIGNQVMTLNLRRKENPRVAFDAAKETFMFWNRADVRALDPGIPFDVFIMQTKRNMTTLLDVFRANKNVDDDVKYLVYSFAQEIYDSEEEMVMKNGGRLQPHTIYLLMASKYHLGLITIDELLQEIDFVSTDVEENDYSNEARLRVIRYGSVYISYLTGFSNYDPEKTRSLLIKKVNYINEYIRNLPNTGFDRMILNSTNDYMRVLTDTGHLHGDFKMVLDMFAYRHFPSYVHSNIVNKISLLIINNIIKNHQEIIKNSELKELDEKAIKNGLRLSSLSYSMGKSYCLNQIKCFSRDLKEIDKRIIQTYPVRGATDLLANPDVKDYADVALYHQRDFNGNGGYPDEKLLTIPLTNKLYVDIIKIADSIEAACDKYFRPYRLAKELEDVVLEMNDQKGKKYSDIIIDIINNDGLLDEIRNIITEEKDKFIVDMYLSLQNMKLADIYKEYHE